MSTGQEAGHPVEADVSNKLVQPSGSSTAFKLKDHVSGWVNVRSYGAKGDGVTDDTAAIQAAVTAATPTAATIVLPPGTYKINTTIVLSTSVRMIGASYRPGTTIQAGAAMTAMIEITEPADAGVSVGPFEFKDFHLDGNHLADVGIKGLSSSHVYYDRVKIRQTLVHAVDLGYGWNHDFHNCQISNNDGDGIFGEGGTNAQENALNLIAVKVLNNAGFGVRMAGRSNVFNSIGSTFEANAKGALFFEQGSGPVNIVGNYFESNGGTGYTFTTPALTVKADIILNGVDGATLGTTTPVRPVNIEGNMFSATTSLVNGFVYLGGARNVRFVGNRHTTSGSITKAFAIHGQSTYSYAPDVTYDSNVDFDDAPAFIGGYAPSNGIPAVGFHTWRNPAAPRRNYWPLDLDRLALVVDRASGTIARSAETYGGWPAYEITGANTESNQWGITIDVTTKYPELAGKLIYAAAWVHVSQIGSVANARLMSSVNGGGSTQSNFAFTNWQIQTIYWVAPSSGTFTVSIEKLGNAGTSAVSATFSRVVVAAVGAPFEDFYREVPPLTVSPSVSADRGDTSQTLTVATDVRVQRWATTLTANRTVTLSTAGAVPGDHFRVVRTGLGAFTLDVGGLKTIPSATAGWVEVSYDGSAWVLAGWAP